MKNREDIRKIKSLIDAPKVVMMATRLQKIPFSVCPMTIQELDEQGDIWFISNKNSGHFKDIDHDNKVQLIYADDKAQKYISIFGNATHVVDQEKLDEFWDPQLLQWFTGKDDPNIALLNVNISSVSYWNSQLYKLESVFSENDNPTLEGKNGTINMQH